MDCCDVENPPTTTCPSCGQRGRKVGTVTLTSLVPDNAFETKDWKFCRTLHCPVAYYSGSDEWVSTHRVSVTIFQKVTTADRPVCYCFSYSARDIERDEAGQIPADIKDRCRRGQDRCPEMNPQGTCCLGNVLAIARRVRHHDL
ncbi:MAG: hypothetical protein ACJAZO_001013 [Myxococcota bacterium]|jgi:hypothetical protein